MDVQKQDDLIKEAFEIEAEEIGFCLDQLWGDYENPYENSDTALAFNLFKKGWLAKAQAVPEGFVEKTESNTHHYFKLKDWDEWTCIDGIKDAITSDHDINAIVEVECLEVIEINNKPCFALLAFGKHHGTEVKFFDTEEEAIEAQEPAND
ncbi:hypothetical protein H0S57_07875 [Acinetobacter johnsonii]|uniref:hypothetical protein n=1 Tax=Acinetobacter johnsonii TaxID=40214 RepID=UPI00189FA581|nr:hypothetical protein [Acinetobacter johnsonii]QPF36467.1 hypothetical protein H0S57_07875 [Acinetobacter johnsonii]